MRSTFAQNAERDAIPMSRCRTKALLFRGAQTDVPRTPYTARYEHLKLSRQPGRVQDTRVLLVLSAGGGGIGSAWHVSGSGMGPFGGFYLSGEYNAETGKCAYNRHG
jgi:hypothetical protein